MLRADAAHQSKAAALGEGSATLEVATDLLHWVFKQSF